MIKKTISFICISAMLSSCATIFSGSNQMINIKAVDTANDSDLQGAVCSVTESSGRSSSLSSPGKVLVQRGGGLISVKCKKEGYKQLNTSVGDSFNPVSLINVLFWPGLIIDAASGAYKKYPSHFVVSMEKIK